MKIGILGGTFNPPHIGHLILAQEIIENLTLDKIFFIPTNISPHKENNNIDVSIRFNMVKLAVADNKYFEALNLEIKRGGISYTIDTVRELKNSYPGDEFYLIVGSDLANTFSTWKDFEELRKIVEIVVARRENYPLREENGFTLAGITQVDISSSRIRKLAKKGHSVQYLVKDNVADYIKKCGLYRE